MAGKVPLAAFCEEYDEDANAIVPESRRVANATAKRSKPDSKPSVVAAGAILDTGGSDSGYSSRTAATANSAQSVRSGWKSSPVANPPPATATASIKPDSSSSSTSNINASKKPPVLDKSLRKSTAGTGTGNGTGTDTGTGIITTTADSSPSGRKDRTSKDLHRSVRSSNNKMQQPSSHPPPLSLPMPTTTTTPTTPNKSSRRERESAYLRHYPGTCLECDQGLYHASTPIEPSPGMKYPYYPAPAPAPAPQLSTPMNLNLNLNDRHHPAPPPPPHPSPSTHRYPPAVVQDVHVSNTRRPHARTSRSNSYNANKRPMSYHGAIPGMGGMGSSSLGYNMPLMNPYEYGPPPSSSAYANTPAPYVIPAHYSPSSSSSSHRQPRYYHPDYVGQSSARSGSRTRDLSRPRRSSVYGPPVLDHDPPAAPTYEDAEPLERRSSRGPRASASRRPSRSSHTARDPDEDFYRMPPPPRPSTSQKSKPSPQIIQKRPEPPQKSATSSSVPRERRSSRNFDFSEMEAALPERPVRRSNREVMLPERSHSTNEGRRPPTVYRRSPRPSRMSLESPRRSRRRSSQQAYHYDGSDLEEKQREAEEYQAARSGKSMPLMTDALVNAKSSSHALESDSGSGSGSGTGSQKSHSSRGSDTRTRSGNAVGSPRMIIDENNGGNNNIDNNNINDNIYMTVDGMTIGFTRESVDGKRISVRRGDSGAVQLNIEGKRPKKYLPGRSDYSGGSVGTGRRELEDVAGGQSPREDRRSERASRRSSRSTYGAARGGYD